MGGCSGFVGDAGHFLGPVPVAERAPFQNPPDMAKGRESSLPCWL
ncbi:hypothetical protein ARZXY2_437 [Arthrobacter sp. ZXY-2]|nr:hypothetical protein ARZXY2_437 [Arthrobacter sp. ZXY-2]